MRNKSKMNFLITSFLFALFIIFTIIVSTVDVQPIGPLQSKVGLARINKVVFDFIGVNLIWYKITDALGIFAILFAIGFAVYGLIQLIQRKSIFKVDFRILILGVFYAIVIGIYIMFEKVILNYRPIIIDAGLEASYPSSHAMIVVCIMASAMILFQQLLAEKKILCALLKIISVIIIGVTIVGRLISGTHWFTDIIGGIFLSAALVMFYYSIVQHFNKT